MSSEGSTAVPDKAPQQDCLACHVIRGGGLMAAGIYVYIKGRNFLNGRFPSLATGQMFFGVGLTTWGFYTLAKAAENPSFRKQPGVKP